MEEKEFPKIHVQYCKSCSSHNWCTHHDQQKYKRTFQQLSAAIHQYFPQFLISYNVVPSSYVLFRAKENKYFDQSSNKYVIYPSIGSFEVTLDGEIIFSKKQTNSWPVIEDIVNEISMRVEGRPIQNDVNYDDSTTQKETILKAKLYVKNSNTRTTFFKEKEKENKKQFTLTDHFKHYKLNKEKQMQNLHSLYAENENVRKNRVSKVTPQDIQQLNETWGNKENLPEFIREKAFIQQQKGKKQMLVNLSCIEEEKDCHNVMKKSKLSQFDKEFNKLQTKFNCFEKKVKQVNRIKQEFEEDGSSVECKRNHTAYKLDKNEKKRQNSPLSLIDKIHEVNTAYQAQKILKGMRNHKNNKIEKYIQSSQHEKNEKLEEIYGQNEVKNMIDFQTFQKKIRKKMKKENRENNRKGQLKKQEQSEESEIESEEEDSIMQYPHYLNQVTKNKNKNDKNSFHSQEKSKKFHKSDNNFNKTRFSKNTHDTRKNQSRSQLNFAKKETRQDQKQINYKKLRNIHEKSASKLQKYKKNQNEQIKIVRKSGIAQKFRKQKEQKKLHLKEGSLESKNKRQKIEESDTKNKQFNHDKNRLSEQTEKIKSKQYKIKKIERQKKDKIIGRTNNKQTQNTIKQEKLKFRNSQNELEKKKCFKKQIKNIKKPQKQSRQKKQQSKGKEQKNKVKFNTFLNQSEENDEQIKKQEKQYMKKSSIKQKKLKSSRSKSNKAFSQKSENEKKNISLPLELSERKEKKRNKNSLKGKQTVRKSKNTKEQLKREKIEKSKSKSKKSKKKNKTKNKTEMSSSFSEGQIDQSNRYSEIQDKNKEKEDQNEKINNVITESVKRKKNLKGSKITVCSKGIQKNNTPREKEAQENEKYRDRQRESKNNKDRLRSETIRKNSEKLYCEMKRARIIKQIYGCEYIDEKEKYFHKYKQVLKKQKLQYETISKFYKGRKILFDHESIKPELLKTNSKNFNVIKVIRMLCLRNQFLIVRLFQNPENYQQPFGVWLCDCHKWKCIVFDSEFPIKFNKPYSLYHEQEQLWPIVLEKSLAILYGGYENLEKATIEELFHNLTGSNSISLKIHEDISKSKNFLKHLSQNYKKNFIISAQKRFSHSLEEQKKENKFCSVFYVLSQKTINQNQVLIKMKQNDEQSFWVKLDKFVQQFSDLSILQLRVNHNFTFFEVPLKNNLNYVVVQMQVSQTSFGSINLSNKNKVDCLRVFLYKEEQQNMLKLVGKAKQKNKKLLFFDCCFSSGKYFLFVQASHPNTNLSYFGQGMPSFRVKQQIQENGLKNDYTEYVAVDKIAEKQDSHMPKFMKTGFSKKSNQTNEEERLRLKNEFINYLMKK